MKMRLMRKLMNTHISTLNTKLSGARTEALKIMSSARCMFCTSVVIRVMSPPVENRSMLENEKVWMFLYIASRRLYAKPVEA